MKTILIVDTETTGLPNFKLAADHPEQPWIVQVSARLHDDDTGDLIEAVSAVVKPDGWTIPDDVVKIHGITTERALASGRPHAEVMAEVAALMDRAHAIAAYSKIFDLKMLRGALRRAGLDDRYQQAPTVCIMDAAKEACRIPPTDAMMATGRKTSKTPKLEEAYEILFGETMLNAHDADADAAAAARIYFHLKGKESTRRTVQTPDERQADAKADVDELFGGN